MEDRQKPQWLDLLDHQIQPDKWFRPVDQVWREHGWVPPSTECKQTMAKHKAFRTWTYQLPAGESNHE
jgi:hypothetical protein